MLTLVSYHAAFLIISQMPASRAVDVPATVTSDVRLQSGRIASYILHFDRNALQGSVRHEKSLIALTSSGNLLRFDLPSFRLSRERIGKERVDCICRGKGETILAGLANGQVCSIVPETLDLKVVARLTSSPQWIGWRDTEGTRPGSMVVLTEQTEIMDPNGRGGIHRTSRIHDLATGRTITSEQRPTSFLLDGKGRLWLGADKGEWGGWVSCVDLSKGTIERIKAPQEMMNGLAESWTDGVYGFIELHNGQIWAYGGTLHGDESSRFIARVDGPLQSRLLHFEVRRAMEEAGDSKQVTMPIMYLVEETDNILVFTSKNVFRCDMDLKSWKKVADLTVKARVRGATINVETFLIRSVHPPRRAGEGYILATNGEGYVSMDGKILKSHMMPGQLGASSVSQIENTREGILLLDDDQPPRPWCIKQRGWEIAKITPAFEPDPNGDSRKEEQQDESWAENRLLVNSQGTIFTVSGTTFSPGTRTTAVRVAGKSIRIGREVSRLDPVESFISPDGVLWNVSSDSLKRFETSHWREVRKMRNRGAPMGPCKPLETREPPWLILDQTRKDLWRLDNSVEGSPSISPVPLQEGGTKLSIGGGIRWTDGLLLLTTNVGMRTYSSITRRLSHAKLPEPPTPASTLVRDGRGRLWLGSSAGLWLIPLGGMTLETIDQVPGIGQEEVCAIASDPQHADGVIIALRSRGVLFLQVSN